jgi:hypothetical protein
MQWLFLQPRLVVASPCNIVLTTTRLLACCLQSLWWLAISAMGSVLMQAAHEEQSAHPEWATTRLADLLAPGIKMDGLSMKCMELGMCMPLLMVPAGMMAGGEPESYQLWSAAKGAAHATPTLVQLQALAELSVLMLGCSDDGSDITCLPVMLLARLMAAADTQTRAGFLANDHLRLMLVGLGRVAAFTAFEGPTLLLHPRPPTAAASLAAQGEGASIQHYTLTAPQLVVGQIKLLTMENSAGGGTAGETGTDKCAPDEAKETHREWVGWGLQQSYEGECIHT